MAWTETTRAHYRRDGLRYASDMTDAEWALLRRLLPPPCQLGRPRTTDLRRVVEAGPLYSVDGLSVARAAAGVSAILDGSRLLLCLARYRKVAKDRHRSGPASATEAWAHRKANGGRH